QKLNSPYHKVFSEKFNQFLASGYFILGENVREFESQFASFCGVNYGVGTGNGLDALKLILRGYVELNRLEVGDEVVVPANTYIATILAVKEVGLKPVLVEPDEQTFNLNPD